MPERAVGEDSRIWVKKNAAAMAASARTATSSVGRRIRAALGRESVAAAGFADAAALPAV